MNKSFSKIYIIILSIASIAGLIFLYWLSTPRYLALKSGYNFTITKQRFFITVDKKEFTPFERTYAVIFHPKTDTTPESRVYYNIYYNLLFPPSIGTKILATADKVVDLDSPITSTSEIKESGYYKYDLYNKKFVDIDPKTEKPIPLSSFSLYLNTFDQYNKEAIVIAESGKIDTPSLVEETDEISPISLEIATEPITVRTKFDPNRLL